jgi:hypothetical protein
MNIYRINEITTGSSLKTQNIYVYPALIATGIIFA